MPARLSSSSPATSPPATNPCATLAATLRSVRAAEAAGAGQVVIDTSGYLAGRGALELKSAKLDALAPLDLIVLGDAPEIRRLLAAWYRDPRLSIHRLACSEVLLHKSRQERTIFRQQRFAEALAAADLRRVSMVGKALSGLATVSELQAAGHELGDLQGQLLCFHDVQRRGLCLGVLQSLDLKAQEMLVRAPALAEEAAGIMFGSLKLSPQGEELGRL